MPILQMQVVSAALVHGRHSRDDRPGLAIRPHPSRNRKRIEVTEIPAVAELLVHSSKSYSVANLANRCLGCHLLTLGVFAVVACGRNGFIQFQVGVQFFIDKIGRASCRERV